MVQRERGEQNELAWCERFALAVTLGFSDPVSFFLSQLLSEIEEHLKCTITQCDTDIKVPVDEFDGKVTYGQRRALGGIC